MRYPTMGSNPRNAVSVPALSGGVNMADALNLVDDNQMTDCKNVWYEDGFLKTRPGLQKVNTDLGNIAGDTTLIPQYARNEVYIDDIAYKASYVIFEDKVIVEFFSAASSATTIKRFEILKSDFAASLDLAFNTIVFYNGKPTIQREDDKTGTTQTGKGLYAFISFKNDYVFLFELVEEVINDVKTEKFEFINSNELYTPTIYMNGKSEGFYELAANVQSEYAPATMFEGYNAITNAWSAYCFTTDAKSNVFRIPVDFNNSYIQFEYTDPDTGRVYKSGSFEISNKDYGGLKNDYGYGKVFTAVTGGIVGSGASSANSGEVNVFFASNYSDKTLFFWVINQDSYGISNTTDLPYIPFYFRNALGKLANNLKIIIRPIPSTYGTKPLKARKSNFARMTVANSFGSDSEGVLGGNRIFLAGSSGKKKNMLAWSDVDNPTYFSENNYVHVGDGSQQIVNLKKQDNMLVIFKNNEIFYTVKSAGSSYTAEDVILGKVVDVSTLDATFPIIQISDKIGCSAPHSVQLCGNRLVWVHNHKVYMLRSANQYSNVNVSVISNMLGSLNLSVNSSAVAYKGYYVLLSANNLYLLNYDQYYFNSLPSYADTKKANRKLQWHIWEIPERGKGKSVLINDFENLAIHSSVTKTETEIETSFWNFSEAFDFDEISESEIYPIESVVQTKMFNFGAMERFKSIEQMYVEFGKCESDVNVQYLTERGRLDELTVDLADAAEEHSPEFIKTKRLLPGIKRALRFGMRLTAKGQIKLGGILIKFKYMGVTR